MKDVLPTQGTAVQMAFMLRCQCAEPAPATEPLEPGCCEAGALPLGPGVRLPGFLAKEPRLPAPRSPVLVKSLGVTP